MALKHGCSEKRMKIHTVFSNESCLRTVLGTRLTDRIPNCRLYGKCGSIPLSRAIMKEMLRWLRHVLRMKHDRLPKIVFSANHIGVNGKLITDVRGGRMS